MALLETAWTSWLAFSGRPARSWTESKRPHGSNTDHSRVIGGVHFCNGQDVALCGKTTPGTATSFFRRGVLVRWGCLKQKPRFLRWLKERNLAGEHSLPAWMSGLPAATQHRPYMP